MADRETIRNLLGWHKYDRTFVDYQVRSRRIAGSMIIDDLLFATASGDHVPAYFVAPVNAAAPTPALLYCHAHGNRYDIGREELFQARPALGSPYAESLVAAGYSVLCLEMPCFGERAIQSESATAKACLWRGHTLYGWMLAELSAGVDFLLAQPGVDTQRIGVMGISMGGTHAWWMLALDERLRAGVSLCCFADMALLIETGQHDGHGHYMTVPGLLEHCSTAQLAGLAAPRPLFIGAGLQDWSTPAGCFEAARHELESTYISSSAESKLYFHVEPDTGHEETPLMRSKVLQFLTTVLG